MISQVADLVEQLTDFLVLTSFSVCLFPFKFLLQTFRFLNTAFAGGINIFLSFWWLNDHGEISEDFLFSFFLHWQFMIFFPVTVLSFVFNELETMDCFEAVLQNAARFLKHLCITTCGIFISSLHFYVLYSIWGLEWDWTSPKSFFNAVASDSELCGIMRVIGSHKIATGIYIAREDKQAEVLDAQPDDNVYMRMFIYCLNFILTRLNLIDNTRKRIYRPWIIKYGFEDLSDFNYSVLAACGFIFLSEILSPIVPLIFSVVLRIPMYIYFIFASFLFPTRLLVGLLGLCWSMLGLSSYFFVLVYILFFVYPNSTA